MTTTKRIERLWSAKDYARLLGELLSGRSEDLPRARTDINAKLAATALGIIRLDEFNQSHLPLCGQLIRMILTAQEADGGWADPMTTALCVRALHCSRGNGVAGDRGLEALARLQKSDGSFPAEPIRRLPSDAFATAFVVYEVGDIAGQWLDVPRAMNWLASVESSFDDATRIIADRLKLKYGAVAAQHVMLRQLSA
ncbi:MAG TPA: hypothetical protein VGN72_21185 [Tepidisphaeraceae bacterium]|nr:hypothetical protein [Tepidisphaeraceae bacterium]